mmetsp:Transcript_93834/g.261229  ORF Transcript_93834/g.261229 Transcript_93834/m.261229 type:complete len:357 (+) Transcript_93834:903-1973(+)
MLQYSFLESSSSCSFFRVLTMLSIIAMTFSKPTFLPRSAKAMRSSSGRPERPVRLAPRNEAKARARRVAVLANTCTKLEAALGRVFLNRSSASSLARILMVSASAVSSAERVLERSSHAAACVLQPLSSSDKYFLSERRASSVSERSFFICMMVTARSPLRLIFVSIDVVSAATSFFFATIIALCSSNAASSAALSWARSLLISSPICFKIPVTSLLCGTYSELCVLLRNDNNTSRSSSTMSWVVATSFCRTWAVPVCKKLPAIPFSSAATAFVIASMFELFNAFSVANAAASFSRMDTDSDMVLSAALRSACAFLTSSSSCFFCSSSFSMLEPNAGTLASAALMLDVSAPSFSLQ